MRAPSEPSAQSGERHADHAHRHVGQRSGDRGERVAERLVLQHRAHDQAAVRQRRGDRPRAPARRRQPAVGEHPGDRGHADEQQRPGAVGDHDRPRASRQRVRVAERGVARVGVGEPDQHEHRAVGEQQPADRVTRPARDDQQPERDRHERDDAPGEDQGRARAVTRQRVQHSGGDEQDREDRGDDPRQSHSRGHHLRGARARTTVPVLDRARCRVGPWHARPSAPARSARRPAGSSSRSRAMSS